MQTEKFAIENPQGYLLAGTVSRPDKDKGKPVLLLHGFTGYKEEIHLESLSDTLVNAGYMPVRFDASGFGESEGPISQFTVSNYLSDVETVYRWITSEREKTDPTMHVVGTSLGGLVALYFARSHADVDKVCVISSPTKLGRSGYIKDQQNAWKKQGYLIKSSSRFGRLHIPYTFYTDAQKYDALDILPDINSQLLVIAGDQDTTVPAEETMKIFAHAQEPKHSILIEGMRHDYKHQPDILKQVNESVVRFLLG
ncbi:MAG: Thermostable monoacylglycerol lipase [candidate division WS6 bacterium OLB20]|uniref:Thermostable monoacylglycerol lipase n=1 Tax=candidate division WS6 bacterium OLB20 TaxID=1617426 RepID=A0A136M0M7_9BACT|nr:MAG: Thermostable monoacylglycerol lipase [candidate division WS6 bacterium OLB20]